MAILTKENYKQFANQTYPLSDIIETEYPEIDAAANDCFHSLEDLQKMVVDLLPPCKKKLHDYFVLSQIREAQICMMNYLKLRSLYGLANFIGDQINCHCRRLASCALDKDQEGEDDAKNKVLALMEHLSQIPFVAIAQDEACGFFRLHQLIESLEERMDFLVLQGLNGNNKHVTWSYRDLTGTIANNGLQYESLWAFVAKNPDPTAPSIGGFMEEEENDDKKCN